MKAVVCLDEGGGMLFNHRRQSRDRQQIADLWQLVGQGRLWCAPFSAPLFAEGERQPLFDEAFLEKAGPGDYCLVEDRALSPYLDQIEELIVYHWNRVYPRDLVLDIPLPGMLHLAGRVDLPGYSHECITRERYIK